MFNSDDSMKIDDINKVAKRHMVYIWPEKGVFAYTYTWKSWHLVGFEPTLFGRAKVQPHHAYQPTCQVPQVGDVTAICRGSMTGKILTRQLNGKLASGGI